MEKTYWVYILASRSKVLYIGVTNNLMRRVYEHRKKLVAGFTQKYNTTRLVNFETTHDVRAAIRREKHMKGWLRAKKLALIKSANPKWEDLSEEWFRNRGPVEALNRRKRNQTVSC